MFGMNQFPAAPGSNGGLGGLGGNPMMQAIGMSLLSSPRNAPLSGFGDAYMQMQGIREKRNEEQQRLAQHQQGAAKKQQALNATRNWLLSKGMSEADADAAVANPAILSQLMKGLQGSDGAIERGLTPQYGVDAEGNPVLIQLGKDGTAVQTALPDGVKLSKQPIKLDAGTHFVLLDPITRQPVGTIPKENYQEAFDTASGSAQGKALAEAQSALPGARGMAALIDSQVEGLKNDPYLDNMLGPVNSRLPNMSTEAARVQAKMDQLSGGAFLQARQMLKGGGAITDFESNKAEQAFIRMNAAQSPDDFKKALDEFNQAVQDGVRKLEMQSGGASAPSTATPAGTSLKDKYGLD